MKRYRQLVKELPAKKVVFAFGRFQPPTNGHALLVNAVTKLARAQGADHVIYTSRSHDKKSNPLPVDRKVYYLKRMFPRVNFMAADESVRTFMEVAAQLSKKYKHLVMIAGSDRVPEYKKLLDKYNGTTFKFETIEVVSAGERDPDADNASGMSGTKMREAAKKGDFTMFKKGLPHTLTELDAKRLMNELREGMGMDSIKESVQFERDELREKYHAGEILNVGDFVLVEEERCEIVKRGSNHILVQKPDLSLVSKWINEVAIMEDITPGDIHNKELTFNGYTTKTFKRSEDAIKAFTSSIDRNHNHDDILSALKATDAYMALNDKAISGTQLTDAEKEQWIKHHEEARDALNRAGEFAHHQDYWHMHQHELEATMSDYPQEAEKQEVTEELTEMKYTAADKIKVARVIATSLGIEDGSSNPELLVNTALRRIKNKTFSARGKEIIANMIDVAKEAGIKYDEKLAVSFVQKEVDEEAIGISLAGCEDDTNPTLRKMKIKHHLGEEEEKDEDDEEMSDEDLDKHIDSLSDDDMLHGYDDDELDIVDDETGEKVDDIKEEALNEVLSRSERIKSKIRFARTQSKRERRLRIALRTRSSTKKVNTRARRLAVKTLKMRIAKKPLSQLSVGEKERLERIIQKRKSTINRLAMRMVPKVRKFENDRLVHSTYTK